MDENEIKLYCYFSYLGPFWLVGLLSNLIFSKALRFHVNQGIGLFICEIMMALAVTALYLLIPEPYGLITALVLGLAASGLSVWLSFKGMMNVYNSKRERITILGIFDFISPEGSRR